ncbi:MAG: ABC transporter ATP-binding protein [Planctomycetales bacterium]|nr:ABC transporter ATP-binding protein [Planctomycetales bacterium]
MWDDSRLVVDVQSLSRRFGKQLALNQVDLQIPPGMVVGLVGANGAGKTTLIKHLLGLYRAQAGSVRVLGRDPVRHPREVLREVGYLSEERELPEWMRIHELMNYVAAFYPSWDFEYCNELLDAFGLDRNKQIKQLSKGMRAQVGLVAAVAQRPKLLILDEPSSGLDAIVRQDILKALVRTVAEDGKAALFSSHLLDEVEQMSDYVVMIDRGRLVLQGTLEEIMSTHHIVVTPQSLDSHTLLSTNIKELSHQNTTSPHRYLLHGNKELIEEVCCSGVGSPFQIRCATLSEVFIARAGRSTNAIHED